MPVDGGIGLMGIPFHIISVHNESNGTVKRVSGYVEIDPSKLLNPDHGEGEGEGEGEIEPGDSDGCTCGACCSCKCTCGKWRAGTSYRDCVGHCEHGCPGDCYAVLYPDRYTHCECHHTGDEGDDPPDIEINMPNFKAPEISSPDYDIANPGMPEIPTPPEEGPKTPWKYFERKPGGWPELKYDHLFKELGDKFKEKFPLDWVEKFKEIDVDEVDLSWEIEINWFGIEYGPEELDMEDYIDYYDDLPKSKTVRLIMLAFLVILFLLAVLNLLFHLK